MNTNEVQAPAHDVDASELLGTEIQQAELAHDMSAAAVTVEPAIVAIIVATVRIKC
jgi:hypothetical protein